MKKIYVLIILLVILIASVIFGFALRNSFKMVGPGLPGDCFLVFKIDDDNNYDNIVMGILNSNTTYNPVTKQTGGESIFPHFQIKKAPNEYYYGYMSVCWFNPKTFSKDEKTVALKGNVGNYFTQNGIKLSSNPEAVSKNDIVYQGFNFSDFYYCYCKDKCTEKQFEAMISDNNFLSSNCRKSI